MEPISVRSHRTVEFGIYRDGDNNLDASQSRVLRDAVGVSARDARVAFTVEDTTSLGSAGPRTDDFTIADGTIAHARVEPQHDMASRENLARFVARTLDRAQRDGAAQTWIELVDHGGGDGGGLETHDGNLMAMPDIAGAIADGIALHAHEHPEDAGRTVDGIVANQCLMATLGFADALSHAGVRYLAASPETMVSPGVPISVAHAITAHPNDAVAAAQAVVGDVMRPRAGDGGEPYAPAAAFDVLDLAPEKMRAVERAVSRLDATLVADAKADPARREAIRADVASVRGMTRFRGSAGLPWHADRPAIAVYRTLASDARLGAGTRAAATAAADAVAATVLAHRESASFGPLGGADYRDAVGPTAHLPTTRAQVDPWAPEVSETNNAFYQATGEDAVARVIA